MAPNWGPLQSAWNSVTQPPAGVTGTGLTDGMTTAQKLTAINGWTVTGTVPTSFYVTGSQILNCINYAELKALTDIQQQKALGALRNSGAIVGGSRTRPLSSMA